MLAKILDVQNSSKGYMKSEKAPKVNKIHKKTKRTLIRCKILANTRMKNLLKRPACNMNSQAGLCRGSFVGKAIKMPGRKISFLCWAPASETTCIMLMSNFGGLFSGSVVFSV